MYVPDLGSLLSKYRDCTTSNDFELYLMCRGVLLLLLVIYIYIYRQREGRIDMYIYARRFRSAGYTYVDNEAEQINTQQGNTEFTTGKMCL